MARRKKFTVGIWLTLKQQDGSSTGLQMWSICKGELKEPKWEWYTVILADDADQALQLAQESYISGQQSHEAAAA